MTGDEGSQQLVRMPRKRTLSFMEEESVASEKSIISSDRHDKHILGGGLYPGGMRFLSILKCGLQFRAAVFGFCRNLNAACGFSKPLGLWFFAFFISGSRFLDAVFGFCSISNAASGILECGVRF